MYSILIIDREMDGTKKVTIRFKTVDDFAGYLADLMD